MIWNILKSLFLGILFGIAIGVFINQLGYLIYAINAEVVQMTSDAVVSQFIISALVGFYCTVVSVVFDVEEWSLLRQTITHFILMLPFFPVAIYAGWMPEGLVERVIFVLLFIIVYIVIWLSFKNYWKKKVKEINEELRKRE